MRFSSIKENIRSTSTSRIPKKHKNYYKTLESIVMDVHSSLRSPDMAKIKTDLN